MVTVGIEAVAGAAVACPIGAAVGACLLVPLPTLEMDGLFGAGPTPLLQSSSTIGCSPDSCSRPRRPSSCGVGGKLCLAALFEATDTAGTTAAAEERAAAGAS